MTEGFLDSLRRDKAANDRWVKKMRRRVKRAKKEEKGNHRLLRSYGITPRYLFNTIGSTKKQVREDVRTFGMPGAYLWNFDITFAAMLIEILTMYASRRNNNTTDNLAAIPQAGDGLPHFAKEHGRDAERMAAQEAYWQAGTWEADSDAYAGDGLNSVPDQYFRNDVAWRRWHRDGQTLVIVPLGEAIRRVIKGCRLYLCNSGYNADSYCHRQYLAYCEATGTTPDPNEELYGFGAYANALTEEYQYGLQVFAAIAPQLWE